MVHEIKRVFGQEEGEKGGFQPENNSEKDVWRGGIGERREEEGGGQGDFKVLNWLLYNATEPDVWCIGRNVIFASRIEVFFWSLHWGFNSLVLSPQFPPFSVVVLLGYFSTEDFPAPLVDQKSERQERDLSQGHLHQGVDVRFLEKRTKISKVRFVLSVTNAIKNKTQTTSSLSHIFLRIAKRETRDHAPTCLPRVDGTRGLNSRALFFRSLSYN